MRGRIDLAQRGNVVQHPEGTPMRRRDQVIAMNLKIVDRDRGKVQLQRLPVAAVVERKINAGLGAGKDQSFAFGIFAHRADVRTFRNAVGDWDPGLAEVTGAINVWTEIVQLVAINSHI